MIQNKKIFIAGCKHTTLELISRIREFINIDGILTITPEAARINQVSGYYDLTELAKIYDLELIALNDYSLREKSSKETILKANIDLILFNGWQRLIPDWFLSSLSIGAFGMHGSNKPLPHGRGRSPLNWSIIQNKKVFFTHLFKYLPGVDDGPIVDVQKFDINPFDTILTLHYKNTLSMVKLCEKNINKIVNKEVVLVDQPKLTPSYYPKRSKEDGIIFWEDSTEDIHNLIKAVTRPFPGAFSFLENKTKVTIWNAQPFDNYIEWPNSNFGEILEVFEEGYFLVKTGDSTILVKEYEGIVINKNQKGMMFHNNNIQRKHWGELPY